MYVKKLTLSNFQCIETFDAEFDGSVYFVTGDNELGKSTLLKAIGALLTGKRDEVLRKGQSKGFAKMVVGDDGHEYEVSLSFTAANPRGTLTIKGGGETSGVSMLQNLFGYQDFDAVEFSRWSETAEGRRRQVAVIKGLLAPPVRERIEAIDTEVADLKAERTGINRDLKTFEGFVRTIAGQLEEGDEEKYSAPIDVSDLLRRQQTEAQLAEKAKSVRATLAQRVAQLAAIPEEVAKAHADHDGEMDAIASWEADAREAYQQALAEAKRAFDKAIAQAEARREAAEESLKAALDDINVRETDYRTRKGNCETWLAKYEASRTDTDIPAMLEEAEAHNKKYHVVCQLAEKRSQYEAIKAKAKDMDARIAGLGQERAGLIESAQLPIAGLTFSEDGLELDGVPFVPGRVSDSQTMEVAAKLIIASNPKVKVFRIARGESLGAKRLQTIIDVAKRNGFQGFIEEVQRGQTELRVEEYTEDA